MKKIVLFSVLMILGLLVSQIMPLSLEPATLDWTKELANTLLYICLGFIMINVGIEFSLDKRNLKSYGIDYFVAMLAAAVPWILVCLYYVFVLLPASEWGSWDAWKDNLLLSRFSAPTSAGILFAMLAAAGLSKQWIYKKIQVLAIFDDLDTILLMIPLQFMMIGFKWQLCVILLVITLLMWVGWKYMNTIIARQKQVYILLYAALIYLVIYVIYGVSKSYFGEEEAIHLEILLPAFVLGMLIKPYHHGSKFEKYFQDIISIVFMFLVGVSMPHFAGNPQFAGEIDWVMIGVHVLFVTIISNVGKLAPMMFYRHRDIRERLALSIGMFTRGEVGAGIIIIAIGYNLGGPAVIISVLSIVLNLVLTGFFVVYVKKLSLSVYKDKQ